MAPVQQVDQEALRQRYKEERDKRLRPGGTSQYIGPEGVFADFDKDPYTERTERDAVVEELDAVILGGGYAGMLAAVRLDQKGIDSFRIIEKAGDFGGTWYWNRYPGAQCDVASMIYMPLLEETGFIPTEKYAHAPEIFAQAQIIGRKFDLYRRSLFQTEVTSMRWDESTGRWDVRTNRGDRLSARFVVIGSGLLQKVKLPGIGGIESFMKHGKAFHTSRWDYAYTGKDLENLMDKRVAVIGTGATAVQCVPELAKVVKQLYVFQRTPSSIDVRDNKPLDPDWIRSLEPGWQRRMMDNFTSIIGGVLPERDMVDDGWTSMFKINVENVAKGGDVAASMQLSDDLKMEEIRARTDEVVKDKKTADALKPFYSRWCKRPCFHDEYLQAFNQPNVTLVDTDGKGVDRMTEKGVVANGTEYEVDLVIFATGFEWGTSFSFAHRHGFEVYGRGGVSLSEKWANGKTRTMHGMFTAGFPNFGVVQLAQTGVTICFPHTLDEVSSHIADAIAESIKRGIKAFDVSEAAEDEWTNTCLEMANGKSEFLTTCVSGYYNAEGSFDKMKDLILHNEAYGGGPLVFFDMLKKWREAGDFKGMELTPMADSEARVSAQL
ncbi:putative monooxygenase [Hyaloraphidium curvatum]|nr:putative monooxygenase [Hyaloraphidium curvatum]